MFKSEESEMFLRYYEASRLKGKKFSNDIFKIMNNIT